MMDLAFTQTKLEMQVKESIECAAAAWGPANNRVKNSCKTHCTAHCNQPDPQIVCQTDCSGYRKIRSYVNLFLQCPPASGGAANSLVEWSKGKELCFGEGPNHLQAFYTWVGEACKRLQNRVLYHNSCCVCSPLCQRIWTDSSFSSRTHQRQMHFVSLLLAVNQHFII